MRTYIPEPERRGRRRWTDKLVGWERAYRANARRVRGARGKRLARLRSEYPERSFAHVCETGGARRSWLRGVVEVSKRYLVTVAAHNLGRVMWVLFGVGTPRSLQGLHAPAFRTLWRSYFGRIRPLLAGMPSSRRGRPSFLRFANALLAA